MANYPIKMLKDENNTPFVPLVGANAIVYNDNETLEEKLDKKLEKTNIIAGDNITLSVDGNNITINGGAGSSITLIDNLTTSTGGQGALDAHQGKVLKEMIPEVIDDVTSTSTTDALSAKQGYNLNRNKQDKLVSGTNIKTVNGNSLLGSGDIQIAGGGNVDDVKVNGTSVVTNKIANIDLQPIEQSITIINNKIPPQASSTNKLADKAFVNSSVQTATANFRGNWDNWSSVPTESNQYPSDYAGSTIPTVNDYLVIKDASDYDSIPIPDAYQKIDYIETSGTQYLDTGITPNQNTVIEMTFETDSMSNNDSFIFGSGYGGGNRAFELYPWSGMFEVNYGASTPFTTSALSNTLYSVKLGMGLFYVNNILSYTFPEQTFETPYTLTLAALHRSSVYIAPNHIKIYKFKSYDDGTLTRNMIPCYRLSDNKKGMYDAVTETFFENAGTGDFIQGPISGETESGEHSGTWRFKYSGLWDEDGKSGWRPEYQVNEMPLTAAQLAALNSGATEESINAIGNKQDRLTVIDGYNQITNWSSRITTKSGCLYKYGAVVHLEITISGTTSKFQKGEVICVIPEEYRPNFIVTNNNVGAGNRVETYIYITPEGNVMIDGVSMEYTQWLRCCITYIIDK